MTTPINSVVGHSKRNRKISVVYYGVTSKDSPLLQEGNVHHLAQTEGFIQLGDDLDIEFGIARIVSSSSSAKCIDNFKGTIEMNRPFGFLLLFVLCLVFKGGVQS
jgi:hypothetical protein